MDKNSKYVRESIAGLKDFAKANGFKIVWRNAHTNCGDFCIFIYKLKSKEYHNRYLVGYDGDWDADLKSPTHFLNCLDDAMNYIKDHKK